MPEYKIHYFSEQEVVMDMNVLFAAIPAFIAALVSGLGAIRSWQDSRRVRFSILKLLITSEHLPLQERLDAYTAYLKLEGNSWMTEYYEGRLKPAIHADIERMGK